MSRGPNKAPSQRQLRVGEEVRHALAWVLERGEVRDPGLHGMSVTVTEVSVSPDLRNATAYVMSLGGEDMEGAVAALNRARPFLRRRIAKSVKLRYVPDLHFRADTAFDQAGHIDTLFADPHVSQDLGPHDDDPDDGDQGDGA